VHFAHIDYLLCKLLQQQLYFPEQYKMINVCDANKLFFCKVRRFLSIILLHNLHYVIILYLHINKIYSRTPRTRALVIRIVNYPHRLDPLGKHFLTVIVLHLTMA
jgi:hypothetical protein